VRTAPVVQAAAAVGPVNELPDPESNSTFILRDRGVVSRQKKEAEMTNQKRRGAAATTDDRSPLFRLAMIATAIGLLLAVAT
jgi:hypothetical protein